MSKSLRRLDVVQDVNTELGTQSSTLTFKPGKPVDFQALAQAVDKAGFKVGSITIWAKGTLSAAADGHLVFTVSGSKQTFALTDAAEAFRRKAVMGQEIPMVARVQFDEIPPRLVIVEEPTRAGMPGMGSMRGMSR